MPPNAKSSNVPSYGLRPSDCPKKRYQKRTGILAVGSGVFIARRCIHNHEHIPILGSVHGCQQVNGGGRVHKTIGQSSGHLPPVLCLIHPHVSMNPLHSMSNNVGVAKGTLGGALTTEPRDLKSTYYSVEYRQRLSKAWRLAFGMMSNSFCFISRWSLEAAPPGL